MSDSDFDKTVQELQAALEIDWNEAKRATAAAADLAKPTNPGEETVVPIVFSDKPPDELPGLTRRAFNYRFTLLSVASAVGGVAGGAISGVLSEFISKKTADERTGIDIFDRATGSDVDQRFVDFIENARHKSDFLARFKEGFSDSDRKLKFITSLIYDFDRGGLAYGDELESLKTLFKVSKSTHSQVFFADMLTSQYVRAGRGNDARDLLRNLDKSSLRDQQHRLFFLERMFSTQYTSLKPVQYVDPRAWGFNDGLELFNDTVGGATGMRIALEDRGLYVLHSPPDTRPSTVEAFARDFHIKGFYAVFWTLHYISAGSDRYNLRECADLQYSLLKSFARQDLGLERAVWNMLFIIALQLHRQGEFDLRDTFISAALGADQAFWTGDVRERLQLRSEKYHTDAILVCFLLFVNSIPELRSKVHLDPDLSLDRMVAGRHKIRPQRISAALDLVRKLRFDNVTVDEAIRDYLVGDGTLGVYLGPFVELKEGLRR
jgi:hypothetical protein